MHAHTCMYILCVCVCGCMHWCVRTYIHTYVHKYVYKPLVISRRRPGTGDIATPPHPSVRLSIRPSISLSVTFSFCTVNFAGLCTKSWGCAVVFLILMEESISNIILCSLVLIFDLKHVKCGGCLGGGGGGKAIVDRDSGNLYPIYI